MSSKNYEAIVYSHDLDFSMELANHLVPIMWLSIENLKIVLHQQHSYASSGCHSCTSRRKSNYSLCYTHTCKIWRLTVVLTRAWETPSQFCIRIAIAIAIEQPGYDLLVEITWKPEIEIDFSSRCSSHSRKGVRMWVRVFGTRPLEVRNK
jgi:hypothetical protein